MSVNLYGHPFRYSALKLVIHGIIDTIQSTSRQPLCAAPHPIEFGPEDAHREI
jgi:hypothetical protein